jgi:hypothetical protein
MKGVAFNAPPSSLLADATKLIDQMAAGLPADAKGAVVGIATEAGWNAAVVHRAGERFQVVSWIGKQWDSPPTGGAAVRASW